MDKATVIKHTKGKTTAELADLIVYILKSSPDSYGYFLKWCNENGSEETKGDAKNKLILELWRGIEKIIDMANEYGGCDYDDEDGAYELLSDIEKMAQNGGISWASRKQLIDKMMTQVYYDNSGFTDGLLDACRAMCYKENDWLYLIEKLHTRNSPWNKEIIMDIYLNKLNDKQSYLDMRLADLSTGHDYFKLVKYYLDEENDLNTSIKHAESGILNASGNISNLFNFLIEHYAAVSSDADLDRLFAIAEDKKSDVYGIAKLIFDYYKNKNYDKAKAALYKSYKHTYRSLHAEYCKLAEFIKPEEWKIEEPKVFTEIKNKNMESYLDICLIKGLKETVIAAITGTNRAYRDTDYKFAQKLKSDYPMEVIGLYMSNIEVGIQNGDRKAYKEIARLLKSVKDIYVNILHDNLAFGNIINNLRLKYKKRPAFIDEVKHL